MKKNRLAEPLTDDSREYVEQLHNRTRKHVDNHCRYLTKNTPDAQDLKQDTYTGLTKRVSSKGPLENHEYEKAYLRTIATNTLRKQQKRNNQLHVKPIPEQEHRDKAEREEAELERHAYEHYLLTERARAYFEQFEEAIAFVESKLTNEEWRLLKYKTEEGLSDDDIGKLIGQSSEFVTHIYRGVQGKARKWGAVFMNKRRKQKKLRKH
jgi:RNA polymerase sigma factor (sigma-70 family)